MISEKYIESRLRKEVKKLGGIAFKWVSPGYTGVPDRLILLPDGVIYFAELKAPKGQPTPRQLIVHKELRNLGFNVKIISNMEQLNVFINGI